MPLFNNQSYLPVNDKGYLPRYNQGYTIQVMKTLAERLSFAMERAQYDQYKLAAAVGMSQVAIHKLLVGKSKSSRKITQIATTLGVDPIWLAENKGNQPPREDAGLRRVRMSPREIVVLNYIQAGHPKEVIDDYAPGDGMERIYVDEETEKKLGPYAFALIVEGDSMEKEYREGDRVLVDPGAAVRPGDVVVAKLDKCDAATLKQYRSRGDDEQGCPMFELVPFNNNYPTELVSSKNPGQIIGPVIEHTRKVRR